TRDTMGLATVMLENTEDILLTMHWLEVLERHLAIISLESKIEIHRIRLT
ncbi:MAG: hypothetical protein H8E76_00145, partial [Helicobacteraceae bacterium]|nr:hypothetical protein [Candidatus Sulfurimonas ponti]